MDQNPLKITKSIKKLIDFVIFDRLIDILIKIHQKWIKINRILLTNRLIQKMGQNPVNIIENGLKFIKNQHPL